MAGCGDQVDDILSNELLKVTNLIEKEVDATLSKYNELSDLTQEKFAAEINSIRSKRLAAMKKEAEMKKVYMSKGHGSYDELSNEKEFFQISKSSDKVVVHFYEQGNMKCKLIDHHLKNMAVKHIETKFVKIEVTKVPFLKDKFRLLSIPSVISVIDNMVKGKVIDFSDVLNIEDHSYKMLEWKLGKLNVIKYDEDLTRPPEMKKAVKNPAKTIRGPAYSSSDSEFSD